MSPRALPEGWVRTSGKRADTFVDELQRELLRGHVLFAVNVEACADRAGASDDVLFRLLDDPERFAIVHLTWRGRPEVDARWPSVIFEGTFEEFVEYDHQHWGLERSGE
jgi:hypothetical protein